VGRVAELPNLSPENVAFMADEGLGDRAWTFLGYSRFDGILAGGLLNGLGVAARFPEDTLPPISGGSDAPISGVSAVRDRDMAPHTPQRSSRPGNPWRSSIARPQSFMWGSSQSRSALPIRLMVSVVMKMASPGKAAIHHEFSM